MSSAGELLSLIRDGRAVTRPELARQTNLSRSTVAERVRALLAHELVCEAGGTPSTGGRPPTRLVLNQGAGVVLAADLGTARSRLAVSDLSGELLAERVVELDLAQAPDGVPASADGGFAELLAAVCRSAGEVWGVGIGVPSRADRADPADEPPPGWDAATVQHHFSRRYDVPVLVDVDVNVRALGERWVHWRDVEHLIYVDAGSSIVCGIVAGRRVHRGAQGVAGHIGHIALEDRDDALCRCGNAGCLDAVAGGRALAARLTAAGLEAETGVDVVRLAAAGEPLATQAVRDAGRALGEVLAGAVTFFNPGAIVIGGALSAAHEPLLAGVREITSARLLPMATRDLRMGHSRLGDRAAVIGAAVLAIEHLLAPETVDAVVRPRRG
ncbi:ROK family transcriptional regulator [Candidatus Solirubrobacter pratensis]|uniref:ROK family transcriptional regulator n=1 Tax=Candidatus Solirubrobacter pratensis TaxID=1298857 RepID=UPI00041F1B21|nr:ROK family transcriptional regulator [Candidatus Solirubrobacter pratensis]